MMSTDNLLASIGFDHLEISCIIGVEDHERKQEQKIYIDLSVTYDITQCSLEDSISDAIDYVTLSNICINIAQEGKFLLIETFAHRVLHYLKMHFPIEKAKIVVKKPSAIPSANYSYVEIEL